MMSNKVLVKADVTQLQTVGGGSGPSARQLFNAARGRGTTPGSKVSRTGRLVGLAGLAGKGAALGATALSTADAMQGGNIAAPLGAGYTYQGLDPTGAMTAKEIKGTVPQRPTYDYTQSSYPIHQFVQNPGVSPAGVAVQQPVQPPPTGYGPVATAPTLRQLQQPQPAQAQPAQAQPAQPAQAQQGDGSMLNQSQMASIVQQQMNPAGMEQYVQPTDEVTGQARPVLMPTKAFNGMLFDLLGPDTLYKMTPNEIGELAAFMYIKTR